MRRGSSSGQSPFDGLPYDKALSMVLKRLLKLRDADIFAVPVDWKGMKLTDYPIIIKHPMDLGTMESNLSKGVYENDESLFWKHLERIWSNCEVYNGEDSTYGKIAQKMRDQTTKLHNQVMQRNDPSAVKIESNETVEQPTKTKVKKKSRSDDSAFPSNESKTQTVSSASIESKSTTQDSLEPSSKNVRAQPSAPEPEPEPEPAPRQQPQQSQPQQDNRPAPNTKPAEMSDPKSAAIAAAVSVRMLQLNACALAILIRYVCNLQASRTADEMINEPLLRHNTPDERSSSKVIQAGDTRESLRLDMGRLKPHELKAVYQLVERLIDSGLVHQFDETVTGEEAMP